MLRDDPRYALVAARRLQWDALLWQVPVVSLTGQAFLFTIALAADSPAGSRLTACGLSFAMTVLSLTLMARHRQAELADAHLLEEWETAEFGSEGAVHGRAFQARRNREPLKAWPLGRIAQIPAYNTWRAGLAVFGLAAIAVSVVTLLAPEWLR